MQGVEKAELDGPGLEIERATNDTRQLRPVEFERDSFFGRDGVRAAGSSLALADGVEDAVFLADNFVQTAAVPGTGNEVGGVIGARLEEEGRERFEAGFKLSFPDGGKGCAAGDGFEGKPEIGW